MPEVPIDLPHLIGVLPRRRAAGKEYGIVIVAEGAKFPDQGPLIVDTHPDPFGHLRHGGIGAVVADAIERHTSFETRLVVFLAFPQRQRPKASTTRRTSAPTHSAR